MSKKSVLAIGAALVASVVLTGCGEDDPLEKLGLPSAENMAAVEKYINDYASCQNLTTGSGAEGDESFMAEEAAKPAWAIKERGVCKDGEGDALTLLTISDMKKFQTEAKRATRSGNKREFLIGRDFAVVPEGESVIRQLKSSKLLFMSCDPDFKAPSGYKAEEPLVAGCVLTDYFPTD